MKPAAVIFLHADRYDRLYQAASLLLTASSMGWPCHLFLFYQALASYVGGTWDEVNIAEEDARGPQEALARGFESGNFPSLYEMVARAKRESGGLRVYACSTSCKLLGLDPQVVRENVDEIVGIPTMLQIAEKARHVLYV